VTHIPVPVTTALLARGRERFDVVCATCHGVTGTGESIVAEKMAFRRPPSLHLASTRAYPPGRLYAIVKDGYGLMPAYASMLDVEERWAIVAYVRALWLSRAASVATLPSSVRSAVEEHAR
jgi:mono/diheme cytochrome c family protein